MAPSTISPRTAPASVFDRSFTMRSANSSRQTLPPFNSSALVPCAEGLGSRNPSQNEATVMFLAFGACALLCTLG